MVGIYVRVSTDKQKDNYSYKDQQIEGKKFADSIGEDYKLFEEAKSGKSLEKRFEWKRLELEVKSAEISKVWVQDLKRFSRNVEKAEQMRKDIKRYGAELYIGGKFFNQDDSTEVAVFQIEQALAEKERKDIAEKCKRGLHLCIDAGNFCYARLYGYNFKLTGIIRKNGKPERKYYIVPSQAETIKYIFDLFVNAGLSLRQVCFKLNREGHKGWNGKKFEYSKMRRTLIQLEYTGNTKNTKNETIKSNVYGRIVSDELFDAAQRLMVETPNRSFSKHVNHICSNLIKCAECGSGYYYHKMGKWEYYVHRDYGQNCKQIPKCVSSVLLDELFSNLYICMMESWEDSIMLLEKKEYEIAGERSKIKTDVERLNHRISELEREKKRYKKAIADGIPAKEFVKEFIEIDSQIKEYQDTIIELNKTIIKKEEDIQQLLDEFAEENTERFKKAPNNIKRNMLAKLFEKIEIKENIITLHTITNREFSFDIKDNPLTNSIIQYEMVLPVWEG